VFATLCPSLCLIFCTCPILLMLCWRVCKEACAWNCCNSNSEKQSQLRSRVTLWELRPMASGKKDTFGQGPHWIQLLGRVVQRRRHRTPLAMYMLCWTPLNPGSKLRLLKLSPWLQLYGYAPKFPFGNTFWFPECLTLLKYKSKFLHFTWRPFLCCKCIAGTFTMNIPWPIQ
jgi:hypothetical protein